MGIFRPDPTCRHGVPLQSKCFKCGKTKVRGNLTQRSTEGTFRTGFFGGTKRVSRHAR